MFICMFHLLLRINTVLTNVHNEGECCLGGKKEVLCVLYGLAPLFKRLIYPCDRTPFRFIKKMESFNMFLAQISAALHRQNNVICQLCHTLNILIYCSVLHFKKKKKV